MSINLNYNEMIYQIYQVIKQELIENYVMITTIYTFKQQRSNYRSRQKHVKKEILKKLNQADQFDDWIRLAEQYDNMDEIKQWKMETGSDQYDEEYIVKLNDLLRKNIDLKQTKNVIEILTSHNTRNICNIGNIDLYRVSLIGTKQIIIEFRQLLVEAYNYVFRADDISYEQKRKFFQRIQHGLGRSALCLSGGAIFGLYHAGLLQVLYMNDILPRIITGSSAGSIIASIICSTEMKDLKKKLGFNGVDFRSFDEDDESLLFLFKRLVRTGLVKDINVVARFVRDNIGGDLTFQEAYEKTGFILNITVTGMSKNDQSRVLNYLTAPNVIIWSASAASCCIPGIYGSFKILKKNSDNTIEPWIPFGKAFIDGSIDNDLPLQRISELFNVTFYIVSQVNPFLLFFMDFKQDKYHVTNLKKNRLDNIVHMKMRNILNFFKDLVFSELKFRLIQIKKLFSIDEKGLNLLEQNFEGHININPHPKLKEFFYILNNPYLQKSEQYKHEFQKICYNRLNYINAMTEIESLIDSLIQQQKVNKQKKKDADLYISQLNLKNLECQSSYESLNNVNINQEVIKNKNFLIKKLINIQSFVNIEQMEMMINEQPQKLMKRKSTFRELTRHNYQ